MADAPGLSFREKSLWLTLASIVVIYAYYFVRVLQLGASPVVGVLFAKTVIAMIVVMSVSHAVLAIRQQPERADERDREIAKKATQIAYYVLMTGVWCALGVAAMAAGTFWFAHAVLLAVVLGEITGYAAQLVFYRRGV